MGTKIVLPNIERWKTCKSKYLHFKYPVPLPDPCLLCRPVFQDGADMLQRSIKFTVDRSQLPTLRHLTAHVKTKSSLSFIYSNATGPIAGHCSLIISFRSYNTVIIGFCLSHFEQFSSQINNKLTFVLRVTRLFSKQKVNCLCALAILPHYV